MNIARRATMIVLMVLFTSGIVTAQGRGPTSHPSDSVIATLSLNRAPFEQAITYLQEQVGGFQVQILRTPGAPEGFPQVTFNGKNVTIGQFMDFVKTAYEVKWEEIPGPRGTVFIARIHQSEEIVNQMERKEQEDSLKNPQAHTPERPQFRIYALSELTSNKRMQLADVLSLVEAAIKQSGEEKLTLQVHESTNTLLATGSVRSLRTLESVLTTLKPKPDDVRREYETKLQEAEQAGRLRQIEFEAKLRTMEVERARMEQALDGERIKLEQAMKLQEAELRAQMRLLEQELNAARVRGPQQR